LRIKEQETRLTLHENDDDEDDDDDLLALLPCFTSKINRIVKRLGIPVSQTLKTVRSM
jgi:hypothetical protein